MRLTACLAAACLLALAPESIAAARPVAEAPEAVSAAGPADCVDPAARSGVRRAAPVGETTRGGQAATAASSAGTARTASVASFDASTAGAQPVTVPVHVHLIRSPSAPFVSRTRVVDQIRVLSQAYAGRQSAAAAVAPYRFALASLDRTTNRTWDRMTRGSRAERRAKRALHRGDASALNLYVIARNDDVLGWATPPGAYADRPRLDGVVIARTTMPGGSRGRYSAGDVAVHESGHWFGLLHTFAGGCRGGDLVADTPPEAKPSYSCPVGRDTCTAPGNDPVHNFMDYSYDSCMNRFTSGQVDRMTRMWQRLRAGGGA